MKKIISVFAFAFLISTACFAESLTASLDRQRTTAGDTLQLTLTLEGKNDVNEEPDFSALNRDFVIVGSAKLSQLSVVNNQSTASTQWVVTLIPKQTGKLTIPAISIGKLQSQALVVDVAASSPASAKSNGGHVFLEVAVQPRETYVQSNSLYTARLFFDQSLPGAALTDPTASNTLVKHIGKDTNYFTVRQGHNYGVVERRYAIIPQASGKLAIDPPVLTAELPQSKRYSPVLNVFFTTDSHRIRLAGERFELNVQPRSSDVASADWLPAQQLTLREAESKLPASPRVGEPLTQTIVVEARGLSGEQLPRVMPKNILHANLYPSQASVNTDSNKDAVTGQRIEKFVVIPTESGTLTLPAIQLPWWNTRTHRAEVAMLPAKTITILPAAGEVAAPIVSESKKLASEIPAVTSVAEKDLKSEPRWFWLTILLLTVWLLTLLAWWWQRRYAESHKPYSMKSLRRARGILFQACEVHNPMSAKSALLDWAAVLWSSQSIRTLGELAERVEAEPLKKALRELDALLYADKNKRWDGMAFWRVFVAAAAESAAFASFDDEEILPPLYPKKAPKS